MRPIHQTLNLIAQSSHKLTASIGLAMGMTVGMALVGMAPPVHAQAVAGKTELYWFGQAGFKIKTPGGKIIAVSYTHLTLPTICSV